MAMKMAYKWGLLTFFFLEKYCLKKGVSGILPFSEGYILRLYSLEIKPHISKNNLDLRLLKMPGTRSKPFLPRGGFMVTMVESKQKHLKQIQNNGAQFGIPSKNPELNK